MLRKVCNILSSFSPRISLDRKTELFCSLIVKSSEEEQTREYVRSGVEQELRGRRSRPSRVTLPIVPSKRPGSLKLDNAKIFEIIPFP